jgi:hypothetical protein
MLDDLSFLTINTMISISVPGVAQMIQQVLLNLIYFDILYTELWFPELLARLSIKMDQEDKGLNSYFEENGFNSKLLMKNIGSTFFFIIIYCVLWMILGLSRILTPLSKKFETLGDYLSRNLKWNMSLQLLFSQFTPMIMSSLINLYELRFDTIA